MREREKERETVTGDDVAELGEERGEKEVERGVGCESVERERERERERETGREGGEGTTEPGDEEVERERERERVTVVETDGERE